MYLAPCPTPSGGSSLRVAAFCSIASLAFAASAMAIPITIDTSTLSGQDGVLAFDLVQGDSAANNNTANVSALATDGALSSSAPFAFSDLDFFNEVLLGVTFGTFLSFDLELTENFAAPGAFDQFAFFVLDPTGTTSLFATTDPLGSDALFAIDITGAAGGAVFSFESVSPGTSWQVGEPPHAVPDGVSTSALAMMVLGVMLAAMRLCQVRRDIATREKSARSGFLDKHLGV